MKLLKLAGLGITTWSLSLIWPQVNQVLTPPVMIGIALGLGVLAIGYLLMQRLDFHHDHNSTGQDQPSHPMPVALTR